MGGNLNIWASLVGLAASVCWTISCSTVVRRTGWVHWVGGVGILALVFCVVSPDDDAIQQELIGPTPPSTTVSSHTKIAQRESLVDFSIHALAAAGDPILALRTGHLVVMDQPIDRASHFQARISIHSPPVMMPPRSYFHI
jgi:hypothetical protein